MRLADLANAVKNQILSSEELVEQSLERLDRSQKISNAFISVNADEARSAARAGRPLVGPLAGLPLAHKDMFDRVGHRCSFGSSLPQKEAATTTATALARVEEAGSITIGALNMAEFALGPTGHNRVFGHCRNPWNPEHITGGSSSGSGAAVASGIVGAALGSDTGGSIRIPAACCGVTGLKPTQGAVNSAGAMPLSPSLDCIGPIARSAEDCELIFRIIADVQSSASPLRHRLGMSQSAMDGIDPQVREAIGAAIAVLQDGGMDVVERPLPEIKPLHDLADIIQKSESAAIHADRLRSNSEDYTPHVRRRIEPGLVLPAETYRDALRQRSMHQTSFIEHSLIDVDALLIPTIGFPVPTIAETDEEAIGALPDMVTRMTHWTRWLNYLGVPAISIPCGIDRNGLPIGMQLVGRPHDELGLLTLARRFQDMTGWHLREYETAGSAEAGIANAS